tara:strand:- start:315 stop:566 length:252 start_codon:yes stop_codon:yes gene_type:complete
MHEFLEQIYFDFCLKNDMPKNPIDNDAYLSADDYLHGVFGLNYSQLQWLKHYVILWDATNGGEDIDNFVDSGGRFMRSTNGII